MGLTWSWPPKTRALLQRKLAQTQDLDQKKIIVFIAMNLLCLYSVFVDVMFFTSGFVARNLHLIPKQILQALDFSGCI